MSNINSFKLAKGNGRVRKAARIAAVNKRARRKSKWQLLGDVSARDFDVVRANTLSSLI
jgi:hypothetical protein